MTTNRSGRPSSHLRLPHTHATNRNDMSRPVCPALTQAQLSDLSLLMVQVVVLYLPDHLGHSKNVRQSSPPERPLFDRVWVGPYCAHSRVSKLAGLGCRQSVLPCLFFFLFLFYFGLDCF